MGLIDYFKQKKANMKYARMLNGYTPIFSQFGDNIYASDVVQQAINCIVKEMKKLTPMHERQLNDETEYVPVRGIIQNVLDNPNPLMTTADFLEKIVWQLFFNYNAFVIPTWDSANNLTGLYPIQPTQVEFLEDTNGTLAVHFIFANNYETTVYYSDVIHVRHNYSVNEFMGGDESGKPNNKALLQTLELNNTLLQGVAKSLKSSFAINGVAKYNTMLDSEKMEENIRELERRIANGESGILPMDIKGEYIPIKRDIKLVDKDTLEFIDSKILRNYGVSLPILTGDYTKEQYEAFYQKTLEPLIISLSQAFTKGIFTKREKEFRNRIMFYAKKLIFMTTEQKLEMIRLLGDSGALYENEKRTAFGLTPLPELAGKRMQSLNYVDINIANQYQLQGKEEKGDIGNE